MSGLDGIFGIIGVGCGLYCLYGFYMLRFKGEIVQSLFLPKDVNEIGRASCREKVCRSV